MKKQKLPLSLNKCTISRLEMAAITAGGYKPCPANLFTLYYCDDVYSGPPTKASEVIICVMEENIIPT